MERPTMPLAVGGAVVIALLLSVVGSRTPSSTRQPSKGSVQSKNAAEPLSHSTEESIVDALARDSSGPWYAFCQEFNGDGIARGAKPLDNELDEIERTVTDQSGVHKFAVHKAVIGNLDSCKSPNVDLQFLITTLPDPIESHLSIEFDRALESLTRAAAIRSYNFERYWLPWRPEESGAVEDASSKNSNHYQESLRREQPGLLIFRKLPDPIDTKDGSETTRGAGQRDKLLLIFLVGETPTGGLNRPAFLKSVRYIEELTSPLNAAAIDDARTVSSMKAGAVDRELQIPIAGPIFSGTLPSLGETIVESVAQFRGKLSFHVVNYSARSSALLDRFTREVSPSSTVASLDLRASDAEGEWANYLCSLGYLPKEMAVLAEEGSAYGNAAAVLKESGQKDDKNCANTFREDGLALTFPRDLSAIRNLAADGTSNAHPQTIAGLDLPSIGVTLSLRQDQTNEHDAPPDFAQAQSSARIDRALQGIVKALHTRRIQAVLVTATNPLDRVFLLEYLHLTVPDVRLATLGADDFMLARPGHIDLSGTIAVTSLPLTENTVEVDGKPLQTSISFPSNAAEGVFLAAANLLGKTPDLVYKPEVTDDPNKVHCADVSIVGKSGFRPAITEAKDQRFYPCFNADTDTATGVLEGKKDLDSVIIGRPNDQISAALRKAANPDAKQGKNPASIRPTPAIWIMALLAALVAGVAHNALVCSSNGLLGLGFLPKVRRFVLSSSSVREVQLFFLFFSTSQVLLLEWLAVTTTYALQISSAPWPEQLLFSAHLVLLGCSLVLCGWLFARTIFEAGCRRVHSLKRGIPATVFVLFTAACWFFLLYRFPLTQDLARLVATRAVYVFEGLSPLLPVFFVLVAYYLWSLNSLQQLYLVVLRVSLVIPRDNDASAELADRISDLQASIKPHIDLNPSVLALLGLTVVGACLVRLWTALRGFEYWPFRLWLVSAGFGLLLVIIVIAFHRAWSIWLQLKKVLHILDAALLGRAFSHVPKDLSSIRVWSLGGSRTSLMVQIRTAELLQRMEEKCRTARAQAAAVGQVASIAGDSPVSPSVPQPTEAESAFVLLRKMDNIMDSGGVVDNALAKKLSGLLNSRMTQTGFLFSPELVGTSAMPVGEKNLLELYVAYRFVAFFRYVMRQLRNKLTFAIYGFACLVVGASVYPFQGRESLGTLMTFVFVLLLGGVTAVIIQMYHDPILKRLEEPSKGIAETFEIATKLIGVAGVPLFAVLASQFPSLAELLLRWFQPLFETSH